MIHNTFKSDALTSVSNTRSKENFWDNKWTNYTALVVDDCFANHTIIKCILRNTGINIIRAENGLKAVEQVYLNPLIDIALMDIQMPVMNGLEATQKILEIDPDLPVIAQTSLDNREECFEAGCVEYINKPIVMSELLDKMLRFLPDHEMVA